MEDIGSGFRGGYSGDSYGGGYRAGFRGGPAGIGAGVVSRVDMVRLGWLQKAWRFSRQ